MSDSSTTEQKDAVLPNAAAFTWTFCGHWNDGDSLDVEYALPGEQEDQRIDTGQWPGGLWAAAGTGRTMNIARADALAAYDHTLWADHDHPQPSTDVVVHLQVEHGYRHFDAGDALEVHHALHVAAEPEDT